MIAELSAKIGESRSCAVAIFDDRGFTCIDVPLTCRQRWVYWSSTASDDATAARRCVTKSPRWARYLSRDDVPEDIVASERRIARRRQGPNEAGASTAQDCRGAG